MGLVQNLVVDANNIEKNKESLHEGDVIARLEMRDKHISLEVNAINNLELNEYTVENDDYVDCHFIKLVEKMPKTVNDVEKIFSEWFIYENEEKNGDTKLIDNKPQIKTSWQHRNEIDDVIWEFINEMVKVYIKNSDELQIMMETLEADVVFNQDKKKISSIRKDIEKVLGLPNIY